MPIGVEHLLRLPHLTNLLVVFLPVMPIGVEHTADLIEHVDTRSCSYL